MKKILRSRLLAALVLGLGISLVWSGLAFAADLNWSADTTITINGKNYVIVSGSAATSLIVSASDVTVTVAGGDTFTLKSTDRYLFTTSPTLGQTCSTDDNRVVVSGPATSQVITPNTSSTCTVSSGGGSPTPPPPPPPAPTPTPTPVPPPPPAPTPTPPSSAPSGAHPNGTLIIDNGTIYLIVNAKRVGFRNPEEYLSHGYNFGQAVAANAQDKALPQAEFVQKALEGTLVLDTSDNRTVYMIGQNGTKRGFTSESVFKALGYNFSDIPKINLSDYPVSDPVGSSSLPHPDGALVLDGKTVWWIRGNMRQGFESEAVFNTYGFKFSNVAKANVADKALAEGAVVKFRDGTLVLDGADYYLISDGKKLKFVSTTDLAARGYKTSSAISASLAAYASGGNVQ